LAKILFKLHKLNLKLRNKQYNEIDILHLIVVPKLRGGRQHNYSTKTRQAGHANEQSIYSIMSMYWSHFDVLLKYKMFNKPTSA
jgi:hypothetical protein